MPLCVVVVVTSGRHEQWVFDNTPRIQNKYTENTCLHTEDTKLIYRKYMFIYRRYKVDIPKIHVYIPKIQS